MKHILKCARPPFTEVWFGRKKFEIRLNDRNYKPGDILEMYEIYGNGEPTGRTIVAKCGYVMRPENSFGGLNDKYVGISLSFTSNVSQSRSHCRKQLGMVAENA